MNLRMPAMCTDLFCSCKIGLTTMAEAWSLSCSLRQRQTRIPARMRQAGHIKEISSAFSLTTSRIGAPVLLSCSVMISQRIFEERNGSRSSELDLELQRRNEIPAQLEWASRPGSLWCERYCSWIQYVSPSQYQSILGFVWNKTTVQIFDNSTITITGISITTITDLPSTKQRALQQYNFSHLGL